MRRWLLLAALALTTSAALAGTAFLALPRQRGALVAGIVVSLVATLAGAVPLARRTAGVAEIGKAAAARLLIGLLGIGAALAWGDWERRTLLLGFAAGYAVLLLVETLALLRLLRPPLRSGEPR